MNKKLIAILTLVMFALTLMPMGAFAATKNYTAGPVITVSGAGAATAASIVIEDETGGNFIAGGSIILTLPSGVKWDNPAVATGGTGALVLGGAVGGTTNTLTIPITTGSAVGDNPRVVVTGRIDVETMGSGDLNVTIDQTGTGVTTGTQTIARFSSKATDIRTLTSPTRGGGNQTFGTIRITENSAGAVASGETIKLRLPAEYAWEKNPTVTNIAGNNMNGTATGTGTRDLTITFTGAKSTVPRVWDIQTPVTVKPDAKEGDVVVSISGSAPGASGDITIGKYASFGITLTAATPKEIKAGINNQKMANLTIKETVQASMIPGRTIRFTLPNGVKFASGQAVSLQFRSGDAGNWATATETPTKPESSVTFTPGTGLSTSATELRLTEPQVIVRSNFQGDVAVTVDGNSGLTGSYVLANVIRPVSVESTPADIVIGRQSQPVNDFYIVEGKKEAIRMSGNNKVTFNLPAELNAIWAVTPKVEVVEGNIIIKEVTRTVNNRAIEIEIEGESTVASKLKVSGARITTNRTLAEGNLNVLVGGNALVDAASSTEFDTGTVVSFPVAVVVSPAEDGTVKPVVMTVGSTVYTVDGVEMTMDVAPYVKSGRTFFPVRFVASAVGISEDNVVWDGAQRTVTIFRGNRIVQVTIGSTTMLVNGIPLTMDVAPEITAGRTMLPIRFVAQGLNVNVTWDAATQTVTLN